VSRSNAAIAGAGSSSSSKQRKAAVLRGWQCCSSSCRCTTYASKHQHRGLPSRQLHARGVLDPPCFGFGFMFAGACMQCGAAPAGITHRALLVCDTRVMELAELCLCCCCCSLREEGARCLQPMYSIIPCTICNSCVLLRALVTVTALPQPLECVSEEFPQHILERCAPPNPNPQALNPRTLVIERSAWGQRTGLDPSPQTWGTGHVLVGAHP